MINVCGIDGQFKMELVLKKPTYLLAQPHAKLFIPEKWNDSDWLINEKFEHENWFQKPVVTYFKHNWFVLMSLALLYENTRMTV